MSLNSKQGQSFTDDNSKNAMAQALQENPLKNNRNFDADEFASNLAFEQKTNKERKQSVSLTMTPTMKNELTDLAKQNGYKSLSEFAVDVFQKILDYNK
ncbi:hypothetical protein WOSG25_070290 [Weissella oryzae SG25]|uniref:Uncharacterized protein n=1 Tax=Weissella oryzae (strain DSM 25784 / JCM 18191 / LMG 30913 / SG25) TaxID=1329250 RepID=A0A069CUH4_WEIOS|nr:hypothetical protein [Weissella oryzae]GAK31052.1 hypothetical protein WOSG25_070290 [Weissella oryzae SG25]